MSIDPFEPQENILTKQLFAELKQRPKRVVFTDGNDERVIRVASWLVQNELIAPILLGNKERIQNKAKAIGANMQFVHVLQPDQAADLDLFCERLEKVERYRGRVVVNPREMIANPHNFAAMMVQYGQADGLVAGNDSMPASVFRSLKNFIKPLPHVPKLFGVVAMVAPHLAHMGSEGLLFMGDCGVNPEPSVEDLAAFADETGNLARHFLSKQPRVALLSHSTHGCSSSPSSQRVAAATALAQQKAKAHAHDFDIIGEVQADVALDPAAAELKLSAGWEARSADVLIFPTLDAGHITFKMMQHVAGAQHYGQLVMGLTRPAAQVPRTASEETILGTAALVGVEAIKANELYPDWEAH